MYFDPINNLSYSYNKTTQCYSLENELEHTGLILHSNTINPQTNKTNSEIDNDFYQKLCLEKINATIATECAKIVYIKTQTEPLNTQSA